MENFDSASGVTDYVTNSSAWHNRSPPIAVAQAFTLLSTKNFDPTIVNQSCGKGVVMREKDLEERGASMDLSNVPKARALESANLTRFAQSPSDSMQYLAIPKAAAACHPSWTATETHSSLNRNIEDCMETQ